MKKGWQTKTLGQLCQLISGQHIDAKDYNTESRGVGYLTGPSDFGPLNPVISKWTEHPKVKAKCGDVLITVKGSGVGKINLLDQDEVAISRQLMAVRATGADPKFVHAILSSAFDHFQSLSTGAAIPGISREQVLGLEIPFPPLPEQQRIVGILDEAFAGLATARANAEKNLQNARALFESHLHSDQAEKALLGNLVNIKTGKLDANAAVAGGKYPFFTCSREVFAIDDYAFDCEAILLAGNNAVGDFNVKHYNGKFNAYQRTYVITVNEKKRVLYRYLYFQMLKSLKKFKAQSVGAGTKFLKMGMIQGLEISLPSLDEQHRIVSTMDSVREETQRLAAIYTRKLAALEALKKSLLHQAFTGEL
ncbi:MAG: restriction endonuclease subunit S [Verrucomicrobiota bacterium]